MPSINRSTGSIANASARYRGLKEIAGGWPSPSPPPETLTANNSWGKAEWGGPAPPSGTHHYVFKLYALKEPVSLKPGANAKALETAIKGKIMAEAKLVGIFSATR